MSFAQEVKDFLGAAQSTYKALDDAQYSKIKRAYLQAQTDELTSPTRKAQQEANLASTQANTAKTVQDTNDPSFRAGREATAAYQRQSTAKMKADMDDPLKDETTKSSAEYRRAAAERMRAEAERIRAIGQPPPADDIPVAPPVRAIGPKPAVPATEAPPPGPMSENLLDEDPYEGASPSAFAATGGMVQKLADGGMVDEDDDPNDEDDVPTPAVGPTDVSAQSRPQISKEAGHDAVVAGLKYGASQIGGAGVPTPARQQRMQALARGAGAAPLADMNAIYKKIDPNNEMGDSERNINALSAVYQHKLRQGDGAGAQRAAFMMLQHYRLASQRFAAISAAAAEHGDIDGAAKAAMKAYANIPDGKDFKVSKTPDGQLSYSLTDEQTGKVVSQGIASPQQLAAAAMGVATKGFDSFLLSAAGERAAGKGQGAIGGDKMPKPKEQADLRDAVSAQVQKLVDGSKDKSKITDSEISAMNNVAYHISRSNDVTPEEATSSALTFIKAPEPKKGEAGAFKITRDEDTGKNRILFNDTGREITMSDAELRPLMVLRGKALKEQSSKDSEPKGKSYRDYASDAAGAIGGMAKSAKDAIVDPIKEATAANRGDPFNPSTYGAILTAPQRVVRGVADPAIQVGRRAIGAIGDAIPSNPGDVPEVDRPL